MKTHLVVRGSMWHWILGVLLLAPIQLGAKGCETGVVGNDEPGSGDTCGGLGAAHNTCAAGQYCKFAIEDQCSAADAPGECTSIPQACHDIFSPVCGCDGKTYGNECTAAVAGISVASLGECASTGKTCGANTGITCAAGEFCNVPLENRCSVTDGPGTCTAIPQACDELYNPVCGCDGKTYSSTCTAALVGVSVASLGECASTGKTCGANTGITCAAGEFCNVPLENRCSVTDGPGVCTAIPQSCTAIWEPICGCDGETYGNACTAAVAGISVASLGQCAP